MMTTVRQRLIKNITNLKSSRISLKLFLLAGLNGFYSSIGFSEL